MENSKELKTKLRLEAVIFNKIQNLPNTMSEQDKFKNIANYIGNEIKFSDFCLLDGNHTEHKTSIMFTRFNEKKNGSTDRQTKDAGNTQ